MAAQSAFSTAARQLPDLRIAGTAGSVPAAGSEQLIPLGARIGDGGRYVIQQIVAIGGMATVYKAADNRLGMAACAIKALYHASSEEEDIRAFRDEARLLASLHHPGIVAVRDYFEEDTAAGKFSFIVQEFVDGQNLYDRHRRLPRFGEDSENAAVAPVPEDQVALYALALAQALDYLHTRVPAVLYRDLKPHNIVRRASDGELILLDFGISRRMSARLKRCWSDDLGTPGYAAPEQYQSFGVLDPRTDLYSLGVILAEMATGYNPRAEGAPRCFPRLDTLPSRLSPTFGAVLQKCLEPHPEARYRNAAELLAALENWRKTPRRLRRFQEPVIAWQIQPDPGAHGGLAGAARTQLTVTGESGALFAAAFPGCALQMIDAASGQTVAARKQEPSSRSTQRFRLIAEPRGNYLARITEPNGSPDPLGAEAAIYDHGLKTSWRLRLEQGRLAAAWLTPQNKQVEGNSSGSVQTSRLALASRRMNGDKAAILACVEMDSTAIGWKYAWRAPLPAEPVLLASSGDGGALALGAAGSLTCIAPNGGLRWQVELSFLRGFAGPAHLVAPAHCPDLILACGGTTLEALNRATGKSLWRAPWIGSALGAPETAQGGSRILLPTRECGLVELDASTGRPLPPSAEFPRALAGMARLLPESDIFAIAEAGAGARLLLYDAEHAKTLWQTPLPAPGASAAPCVSEEAEIIALRDFSGAITAWRWSGGL